MNNSLLLIDGHSLAFRAFYALDKNRFVTSTGQHTNAIHGFLSSMLSLIKQYEPRWVAVAFDLPGGTFRTRDYAEYKAGRAETPQEFKGQVEILQQALDVLGISWFTREDFEADDIVASLATLAVGQGVQVYVNSGDKDSFQLVSDHCTVLYPMPRAQTQVLDREGILKKTGVYPERYLDLSALVGEKADNLPGVPGVGPKTAVKWIEQYGDLAGILEHAEEIPGKAGQSLRDHRGDVERNYRLNHMVTDLPIVSSLEELIVRGVDRQGMHELFDTLDFTSLRTQVLNVLPEREGGADGAEEVPGNNVSSLLDNVDAAGENLAAWLAEHESALWGVAVEGNYAPGRGRIDAIAIATEDGHAFLAQRAELTEADEQALDVWLADPHVKKVCHGAKELAHACAGAGLKEIQGVEVDTLLAAYLLHPDQRKYELEDLVARHLGVVMPASAASDTLPGLAPVDLSLARTAVALIYLARAMQSELEKDHQGDLLVMEMQVSRGLYQMESTGIAVDEAVLHSLGEQFSARRAFAQEQAWKAVGHEVNLQSPKQLSQVLFEELELPPTKKTRHGYTTNADALAEVASKIAFREDDQARAGQEFLGALLEYRDATKLFQSVDGLIRSILPDGRIHTTYQQAVAATGRLSSTDPNLQNIHARTPEGRTIRTAFVPGEGYEGLMTADYSQIEMRLMAALSGDSALVEAFKAGADLHTYVAARVYGIEESQVSSDQRSHIKAMSYGLAYGLSAFGLSRQLHIQPGEARRLMEDYFARFGKVRTYLDSLVEQARRDGYTETILGRRRYLPELTSMNRGLRDAAERMALNAPIQGSAADIIKIAMNAVIARLASEGLRSRVLLQVHDELVLEIAPGEREAAEEIVRMEMEGAADLAVPLKVGIGYGTDWNAAAH